MAEISSSNGGDIILVKRSLYWGGIPEPTLTDNKSTDGQGSGIGFVSNITNLISNSKYYIRSYATNNFGYNIW